MKIGSVNIKTPVALGPMAGVTDLPFRLYARSRAVGYCIQRWSVQRPFFIIIKIQRSC